MLREPVTQLGFDDVTRQGLAYDTGNIACSIPVTAHGGAWTASCVLKPMGILSAPWIDAYGHDG